MKNNKNHNYTKLINKKLDESYFDNFDEFEFDDEAMKAAQADISNSGEDFVELGHSKFEKGADFKDKFKSDLNRANLQLPSDEEEIENLAKMLKKRKSHEDMFGVGTLNEDLNHIEDADGQPIRLRSQVQHEDGTIGYVERFIVGDDDNMLVKVTWIQTYGQEKLPAIVSPKNILVRDRKPKVDEGDGLSHTIGRGENSKPSNYPESLLEGGDNADQYFKLSIKDKIKLWAKGVSEEQALANLNAGLPIDWTGSVEGYYEKLEPRRYGSGTNESLNKDIKKINNKIVSEEYDFAREEAQASFEEQLDDEVYLVVDNDFNNTHYPDLVGKTFENPPGYAQVKVVKLGDIAYGDNKNLSESEEDVWDESTPYLKFLSYNGKEIMHSGESFFVEDEEFNTLDQAKDYIDNYSGPSAKTINLYRHGAMEETKQTREKDLLFYKSKLNEDSSDSLSNKNGENAKPQSLNEADHERYERVIFLQDHQADHALNILKQDGVDDAINYLMQWHQPGNHETSDSIGNGTADKTYEKDGYILIYNTAIGYIGLVYDTEEDTLDEDSQRKRHSAGQINKVAKNVPLGKNSPHSDAALGL